MPTETHGKFPHQSLPCYWPLEFTKRRKFDREAENLTYIEFLQTRYDDGDDDDDGDDNDDVDNSSEDEDEIDGHRDESENKDENRNDDKNGEAYKEHSIVRLFMRGMTGDEDTLQYRDQVEQVASFFEQASHKDFETGATGKNKKRVSLLDDRNNGGTILKNGGHCRPCRGPLTSQQLREALSRKRFRVKSDQSVPTNAFEDEESDAERRLIFITNLDASTVEALTATASRSQAPALKDLLYKYLTRKTSIGVNTRSQGFHVFTLDFHIPYYVLREGKELLKDTRKKSDGKPLRQSWDLPFLSRSMNTSASTDKRHSLYEAQISVAVIGIDHWVWAAYGLVDTYFESDESVKESVGRYDQLKGRRGRPDPLAAGQIDADKPIWTPREYFLRVFVIRIKQVRGEWHNIVDKVENEVKQSRTHHIFPLLSNDPKSRQEVRDFSMWNTQMVKLLRQLISGLSDTVGAWDEFQRKEIGYFLYDGDSPTTSSSLKPSVAAVDKAIWELNGLLRKLQDLRNELCEDNPQGLHAHLSLENNEAAMFQQRTAGHIRVLTVITIVFYPLVLATSLFSTQGVLPFTPNLAHFTYALFILAVLVVVTLVALFNWDSWFQRPIIDSVTAVLSFLKAIIQQQGQKVKSDEDYDERPDVEEIRALEQRPFPVRNRNSRACKQWDLEEGIENGKGDL